MKALKSAVFSVLTVSLAAQQTPVLPDINAIFAHTKAATVIVLAGEGAGRLHSIATGVVISKDGVLLTALHAICSRGPGPYGERRGVRSR